MNSVQWDGMVGGAPWFTMLRYFIHSKPIKYKSVLIWHVLLFCCADVEAACKYGSLSHAMNEGEEMCHSSVH